MTIGLFGGSFNPPHLAHLIVAETVREQFALDAVWWMPAHTPPHKAVEARPAAAHRFEMTRRATASHPDFRTRRDEIERGGPSYTVDTLRRLQQDHPDAQFALLVGGDSLAGFASWHEPDEIARRAELLAYRRPGSDASALPERFAGRVRFAEAPPLDIAATDLRARCRAGRSLRYLVPTPVRAYIEEHGLYRRSPVAPET